MKRYKIISFLITLSLAVNMLSAVVFSEEQQERGRGGLISTNEKAAEFMEKTPEIVDVKLNSLAISRIREEGIEQPMSVPVEIGSEVVTNMDEPGVTLMANEVLPIRVDNSANDSFPPIGDQLMSNSCGPWAFGYYQMTNNIALVNGYNAKTGPDSAKYRMSPAWIYNLVNGGNDNGSYSFDLVAEAIRYGSPSWYDFDGATTYNTNLKTWHPDADLWRKALNNTMKKSCFLYLNRTNGMENLKRLLSNGYVVSFLTRAESGLLNWHMEQIDVNSKQEYVCYYVSSSTEGHFMSIVGYDDEVWMDLNNNGVVDSGEKGAFKIANSWGDRWCNNGYIWLMYNALFKKSAVKDAYYPSDRVDAFLDNCVYFLEPKVSYEPLISTQVTLKTARRNQLGLEFGISKTDTTTPEIIRRSSSHRCEYNGSNGSMYNYFSYENIAFDIPIQHAYNFGLGENYNFVGGSDIGEGTFTFDFTPIVQEFIEKNPSYVNGDNAVRLYVKITDGLSDLNFNKLTAFSIVDASGTRTSTEFGLPLTAGTVPPAMTYIDYVLPPVVESSKTYTVKFNYPIQEQTINEENIYVKMANGDKVPVNLVLSADKKEIEVTPTKGSYIEGTYSLNITTKVETEGGNKLSEDKKCYFYVQ